MRIKSFVPVMVLGLVVTSIVLAAGKSTPKVWVERVEHLSVETADVTGVAIDTHNGAIEVTGEPARTDMAVTVTIKGGGKNKATAQAALDAIEIVSQRQADGTHQLGFKWKVKRKNGWSSNVAFDVSMPSRLVVDAQTHYGPVTATGIDGDCKLGTHNGPITAIGLPASCRINTHNGKVTVDSPLATVHAETHNGAIDAKCGGDKVHLSTHNGRIDLDAGSARVFGGEVTTHNGSIRVAVPPSANAELLCRTRRGSIECDKELKVTKKTRRELEGIMGDGGNRFTAESGNGSIHILESTTK